MAQQTQEKPEPATGVDWARLVATAPPTWVFKQDRRSRVWQVEGPDGPLVVKRYEHFPLKQLLASMVGNHPAQKEARMSKELREKGVSAAPILAEGVQWSGVGIKRWLILPVIGKSLHQMGREGDLVSPVARKRIVHGIADLTAQLIEREYYHRDHKLSNILMDAKGLLWLVDVGAVRRAKKRAHMLRMLAILLKTMAKEDIPAPERFYCLQRIQGQCPFLGDPRKLAKDVNAVKLPK